MAGVERVNRGDSRTQNSRSAVRKRGRGAVRWRTASWCRNAKFSSTRERWVLTPRRRPVRMRAIMPGIIDQAGRKFNSEQTDGVNRRHNRIKDDNPLSAIMTFRAVQRLEREDWRVRTEAEATLSSTRDHFVLTASVNAFEGETRWFVRQWSCSIPRDLV